MLRPAAARTTTCGRSASVWRRHAARATSSPILGPSVYQSFAADFNKDGYADIGLRYTSKGGFYIKHGPAFGDQITSPELWQVVAAFEDTAVGLPARIADLDRVRAALTAGEAEQVDRILVAWRQAPPASGVDRAGGVDRIIGWLRGFAQQRRDFRQGPGAGFPPDVRRTAALRRC